nr:P-type conjugative transfer protein TrbL [uncultured Desulfobacter sp.]
MEMVKMIIFLDMKKTPMNLFSYLLFISILLLFFNGNAAASTVDQSIIQRIILKYHDVGTTWGENLKSHAFWLLKVMLVIQLTWMALKLGLKQSTLQDVIEDLVKATFFGSVFFCLIVYGQDWAEKLITGMIGLSVEVAGGSESAAMVFVQSLTIADNMSAPISLFGALKAPLIGLCIIATLLCSALIYGMYLLILCEAWIVLNLGILLFGFGGLTTTRGFATSFLKYSLGVGLKLFTIKCLIYILAAFLADMVSYSFSDITEVLVITASFIILAFLVKTLPDAMSRMVTLHSGSSAGAMTGAMAAGAGMAAGAASMGVGAAAGAAGGGGMAGAFSGARSGALEAIAKAVKPKEEK